MTSDVENSDNNSDIDSKEETGHSKEITSTSKETTTRRRTKTGCLTCRKRRIKCGEERPVCKNCIKSKRECAGYNHPLVYKPQGPPQNQPTLVQHPTASYGWPPEFQEGLYPSVEHPNTALVLEQQQPPTSAYWQQHGTMEQQFSHNARPQPETFLPLISNTDLPGDYRSYGGSHQIVDPLQAIARDQDFQHTFSRNLADFKRESESDSKAEYVKSKSQSDNDSLIFGTTFSRQDPVTFFQDSLSTGEAMPPAESLHHGVVPTMTDDDDGDNSDDQWDIDMHEKKRTFSDPAAPARVKSIVPKQHLYMASPLLEERSRKIFEHFISVTGPCMGTFDRLDGLTNTGSPRMIWAHGLTALAFQSPALAHAILAISAMHMFKLNLGSENTAMKHFTFALKRVGKLLGDPEQRLAVSTLATVLLLGYYEIIAGDQSRWNLHLSGAGKLVMEHNYSGMVQTIRRMREGFTMNIAQPWVQGQAFSTQGYASINNSTLQFLDEKFWKVDQTLISKLTGMNINYDEQVQPNFEPHHAVLDLNQKTFEDWKMLVELYWWYCKQDVFMSLLSGDPLLLPYAQWKYCPPRGPLNNSDQSHTTLDHLWLLLARLADFGGKDRKRKQRVVNEHGGQWVPVPGFFDSKSAQSRGKGPSSMAVEKPTSVTDAAMKEPPPSANEGRTRKARQTPAQQSTSQPMFYGMLPPAVGPIQMPTSFDVMDAELRGKNVSSSPPADSPPAQDLDVHTQQALNEHAMIVEAFDLFETTLDSDYQPLPTTDIQITTPFGPALQYRTPVVATMWTFFYVGRILLHRFHPHSPPAAMISAGVNAGKTHEFSQVIGRICGGLFSRHHYLLQAGHVDHTLSSAMMETTMSLLFAAVQYQDAAQRAWTITKLREIAQVTGWQTSVAVAAACEVAWEKAGNAGRGPPYKRFTDQNNSDMRLNGQIPQMHKEANSAPNMSAAEEHKLRFVSHDRNLIDKHTSTRTHWALGLLSVEEDLQRITVTDSV